jgi:hypothetical protein
VFEPRACPARSRKIRGGQAASLKERAIRPIGYLSGASSALLEGGLPDYDILTMRTWLLAVSALTLVALTSPINAGEKRSSALAVRVTVVRSCSVNTDSALQPGGTVTCGTKYGPPVMSTSSTISVPVSAPVAPAAVVETSTPELEQPREQGEAQTARQSDAAVERVSESSAVQLPGATIGPKGETVAIRVVTVNF